MGEPECTQRLHIPDVQASLNMFAGNSSILFVTPGERLLSIESSLEISCSEYFPQGAANPILESHYTQSWSKSVSQSRNDMLS